MAVTPSEPAPLRLGVAALTAFGLLALLALGSACTAAAFLSYYAMIGDAGAGHAALIACLFPVFALAFGLVLNLFGSCLLPAALKPPCSHVLGQKRDRMTGSRGGLSANVTRRAESDRVHPSHQLLSTRFYARSTAGELWSPIQQTRLLASPERSAHLIAGRCSLLVRRRSGRAAPAPALARGLVEAEAAALCQGRGGQRVSPAVAEMVGWRRERTASMISLGSIPCR